MRTIISVRAGQKILDVGYNLAMFAARPIPLTIASAAQASKDVHANMSKTTTITG
jgi:hypothetical protein